MLVCDYLITDNEDISKDITRNFSNRVEVINYLMEKLKHIVSITLTEHTWKSFTLKIFQGTPVQIELRAICNNGGSASWTISQTIISSGCTFEQIEELRKLIPSIIDLLYTHLPMSVYVIYIVDDFALAIVETERDAKAKIRAMANAFPEINLCFVKRDESELSEREKVLRKVFQQ